MIKFKQYIAEAAGANLHMTHLEDAVLDGGVTGTRNVINYLRNIRDMLSGNTATPVSLTTKWDGAPALFAGIDPADGKFFIAKKGLFNKNPKLYKTESEIDDELKGDLADKFKVALTEFAKLGIEGVVQGDFLYTNDDLKTENIDGEPHITFHPNTIVYAVPKTSDLGKQISESKIGVVWHTTYRGKTLETMSASFGEAIASKQKKIKSVWSIDAVFQDESGTATFSKQETRDITAKLSAAGKLFRKIKANKLNELHTNAELNARVNTYINNKVRDGERITSVRAFLIGLQQFIKEYYQKQADKVKQQKTKDAKIAIGTELLKYFDKREIRQVQNIFELYNILVDCKYMIINKLNQVEGITTLLKTSSGFEVTGQEGFVAIDHYSKNALKIVDRLEFSKANFSTEYIKGWQK
jgi:cytidylate kinase